MTPATAREWLEWVYANGRGRPADFAGELIEEMVDGEYEWLEANATMVEELAYQIAIDEPDDQKSLDAMSLLLLTANNRYRAIVRTLTEIGVLSDEETADIPAMLRLLIAPA